MRGPSVGLGGSDSLTLTDQVMRVSYRRQYLTGALEVSQQGKKGQVKDTETGKSTASLRTASD